MKKLKRAIANFIIEGRDSWGRLDFAQRSYLISIYDCSGLRKEIDFYTYEDSQAAIKKLMPCFFEE